MFIDRAKIIVVSGAGGDGMVSFRREKYVPRGGPSGGDGGKGGSVFIKANSDLNTLINFRRHRKFAAKAGANGGAKEMFGKNAEDVFVEVPLGTMVYDNKTGELLADMTQNGQEALIVKGGHGGRGNSHFATSAVRAPLYAEKGEPGEEKELRLELKVLADVGLLGFPSVGKSSLIRKVSGAKPEVAAYHFTTLNPILGVVNLDYERSFVMADIPGLIEGAAEGRGLGHAFLRHIERARVLVIMADVAPPGARMHEADRHEQERVLLGELLDYRPELLDRTKIRVAARADLAPEDAAEAEAEGWLAVSGVTGQGTRQFVGAMRRAVEEARESGEDPSAYVVHRPEPEGIRVVREIDGSLRVVGRDAQRAVALSDLTNPDALAEAQRRLNKLGVNKALGKAGAKVGDMVHIGAMSFEYGEDDFR